MLVDAYEAYAERLGCQKKAMVHMVDSYPDILEKLYLKRGYRLVEKHYVKRSRQ